MKKSTTQVNFEKAKLVISAILTTVKNLEDHQMYIVREFHKALNSDNKDLAYNIINEGFNLNHIAGYKYLECCKLTGHRGEFHDLALSNPLCNL